MKRFFLLLMALLGSVAEIGAMSQQSALLTVYGPRALRQGKNTSVQVVWLSVSPLERDSVFLRLFDADCGGVWDTRRGGWNTKTTFELFPAPDDTVGGAKSPADSLDFSRLGRPIASLDIGQDPVYDGKWVTMAGFPPSRGRNVDGRFVFLLVVRARTNDDANRFDVALSTSPTTNSPVASARLWVDSARFQLATGPGQSAEARFFVPADARAILVTTADASRARIRAETPLRSGLVVIAPASGAQATTRLSVEDAAERGADWALTAVWPGQRHGDVYLSVAEADGTPLPLRLPIGIGRRNTRPSASFSMVFLSDCNTVLFDANASKDPDGDRLAYQWKFGDGAAGTGVRITHAFAAPGTYNATLIVRDPSGRVNNRDRASHTVLINHAPAAQFAAPARGAVGERLLFDGSASHDPDGKIVAYEWDFGDGVSAAGRRVRHAYDRPGKYGVRLAVQDNSGSICRTASAEASVLINAAPVARAIGPDRGSPGEILSFDGSRSVDTDGFLTAVTWDFGDGQTDLGELVRHSFRKPGLYRVRLTVRDNSKTSSAEAEDLVVVRINARPVARAGRDRRVAVGETVAFDGRASRDPDGRIITYRWDFGDGSSASTVRARHRYAAPGTYRVRLTVRDDSGTNSDTASDSLSVVVNAPPVADAGAPQAVSTSEVTFDGSASRDTDGSILSYTWDFGDGKRGSGARTVHAYALPGTYRVVLTVTDDSGTRTAKARDTTRVTINEYPVADMGWVRNTIAPGEPLTLDGVRSVDPDGAIASYAWDFGDGTRGTGRRVEHVWKRPGRYWVRLTVRDDSGSPLATDTEEHALTVNAPPVAAAGRDRTASPGETIMFDAAGSHDLDGKIIRYTWHFGDGTPTAQGVRVRHAYAQPGTYLVSLDVGDDAQVGNSVAEASLRVHVNAPPIARLGEDRFVCGTTVAFDGSGSQDPDGDRLTFLWHFGDGTQGAGPLVNHTFPGSGKYIVSLTVTDDSRTADDSDSASVVVLINAPPVADAGKDRVVCLGEPLIFDGSASRDPEKGPLRYVWNFGDGSMAEGANPTHAYTRPGIYEVTLTTTDNSDLPCNTDTDVMLVRVSAPPVAEAGDEVTVCAGEPVRFDGSKSASSYGPITSYKWDFGDDHVGSGAITSHVYAMAGVYAARLTVTTERLGLCDNTATDMVAVTVQEPPKAVFAVPAALSLEEEVTFDATKSDGRGSQITGYAWDFGDGGQASEAVVKHAYKRPGTYTVRLRVITDANEQCRTNVWQQTVRVNAPPFAKMEPVPRAAVREMISFDASGSRDPDGKIVHYAWDFGDGSEATGVSPHHMYRQPGRYRVVLTVRDDSEVMRSEAVDSAVVIVNAPPIPSIKPVEAICAGQTATFDGTKSVDPDGRIKRFVWSFGDGAKGEGGVASHRYDKPGRYVAMLTVYDNSGTANAWASDTVVVRVNRPPVAEAGSEQMVCPGTIVSFDGRASHAGDGGTLRYSWTFGDGDSTSGAVVRHRYDRPGRFPVVLTVRSDEAHGCAIGADTTYVIVNAPPVARIDADTTVFVGGAHDVLVLDASRSTDRDGGFLRYEWDLGDGTVMEGVRVRHAYLRPGRYTVRLTVSDLTGTACSVSVAAITVNARRRTR